MMVEIKPGSMRTRKFGVMKLTALTKEEQEYLVALNKVFSGGGILRIEPYNGEKVEVEFGSEFNHATP